MSWFSYHTYISLGAACRFFKDRGYNVCTMCRFLMNHCGFKSSKEITDVYGVTSSFLKLKFAFTDDELPELHKRITDLLNYIELHGKDLWYYRTSNVIFNTCSLSTAARPVHGSWQEDRKLVAGYFEVRERLKREINKRLIDIKLCEDT